jgi:two-component system, NarL family, invasion response regulator UvrY
MNGITTIALVEDHVLFRRMLATFINSFEGYRVIYEASNGAEFIKQTENSLIPELVLLDLNMPVMDGFDTAFWIKEHHPKMQVLMLTMYYSELTLIRLLQAGVKGFLKKDVEPMELKLAIHSVMTSGYYYSQMAAARIARVFQAPDQHSPKIHDLVLDSRQIEFLKLACSDLTYKEIAHSMALSVRNIDALRDQLFIKLDVKSRVGLAMVAIRNGVVSFDA